MLFAHSWFFSLDCASLLAVLGARLGIRLPYFRATMDMARQTDGSIVYKSQRWPIAGAPARFDAIYRGHGLEVMPAAGSLEHFLTERYCLYAASGKRIWRADIFHPRWSLRAVANFHGCSGVGTAARAMTVPVLLLKMTEAPMAQNDDQNRDRNQDQEQSDETLQSRSDSSSSSSSSSDSQTSQGSSRQSESSDDEDMDESDDDREDDDRSSGGSNRRRSIS